MSADNTLCVLRTPARNGRGFEFRVAEVHAIENAKSDDPLYLEWWMATCFEGVPVFSDTAENATTSDKSAEEEAWESALSMAAGIRTRRSLEHGVRSVHINTCFPEAPAEHLKKSLREKQLFPFCS